MLAGLLGQVQGPARRAYAGQGQRGEMGKRKQEIQQETTTKVLQGRQSRVLPSASGEQTGSFVWAPFQIGGWPGAIGR